MDNQTKWGTSPAEARLGSGVATVTFSVLSCPGNLALQQGLGSPSFLSLCPQGQGRWLPVALGERRLRAWQGSRAEEKKGLAGTLCLPSSYR